MSTFQRPATGDGETIGGEARLRRERDHYRDAYHKALSDVSAAVQEERKKYEWLTEHFSEVTYQSDRVRWRYVPPRDSEQFRYYPTLDALVSTEMRQEKTT